ncbi:MAG: hypothetical protein K5883_03325 [Pseudobutyrivibrio sp.]|nr:hypothetical protein [Pseudobutyrivibrio sp.]
MRKVVSVLISFIFILSISTTAFAADMNEIEANNEENLQSIVLITDSITGEKMIVPTENINSSIEVMDDNSYTKKTEITFSIPQTGIPPLATGTSVTETDVKATISINYDRAGEKVRVNSVSGSWEPSSSHIFMTNREVHYGDGSAIKGHSDHKYPNKNSFSYKTGWGWVDWYPNVVEAGSGARAYSSATVNVSGMTPHTIEAFVKVTN